MNNTVENDFLDFPKYSGYIWEVRWTICKFFMSNIRRISHAKNHKNRLIFDSYSKNKMWTFLEDTVYKLKSL